MQLLTPTVSLKPKVLIEEHKPKEIVKQKIIQHLPIVPIIATASTINEWEEFLSIEDEYNPAIPNEYEKIVKERRERNKKEDNRKRHRTPSPTSRKTGFGGRAQTSDDEEPFRPSMGSNRGGTAIAPPKSLQESSPMVDTKIMIPNINSYGASAVAAKIMAKYGFKDGQGLGKQEQGISMALQVEKTSKRGGRIIHEKEIATPSSEPQPASASSQEQSITEMMKAPSKVIMLRNMVGPGEVDDELEPEVKEECNRKYGEVVTVHIVEMPNVTPEETVRIFVEFTRIESAIKGLVDLNGRFFGGE